MLELMSSSNAAVIGCVSLEKIEISAGLPLSSTVKSSFVRSVTSRPSAPETSGYTATMCTLARNAWS